MKTLNPQAITGLVDLLASDVADMLKAEALAKADPGEETPGEKKPEGSSVEGSKGDDAPPAAPPEASASPPADAPPPGPPGAEGSPTGDPAADASQGLDPEAIKAEIAHLSVEELKAYLLAFKDVLTAKLTAGPGAEGSAPGGPPPGPPEASASAPPPGPPPAGEAPPDPMMGKGEFDDKSGKVSGGKMTKSEEDAFISLVKGQVMKEVGGQITALQKSNVEKDAKITELNDALETGVTKIATSMQGLVTRSQALRKSVAGISYATKPTTEEPAAKGKVDVSKLSKSEATARLREVTGRPDLKKTDRDLVNGFYAGIVPIEKIEHLL